MFEILPSPSLETLLFTGRAGLLVGAFWVFALAFIRWRRADERNSASLHRQLERAFAEVRSLHETVSVMSARLEAMSERSEMDTRRVSAATTAPHRGYDMATRLAKSGADADELISNSGITRHEAELLVRLHGAKARAPAVATNRIQQNSVRAPQAPSAVNERQQAAVAQQPPSGAGRKRGSLLSVVG